MKMNEKSSIVYCRPNFFVELRWRSKGLTQQKQWRRGRWFSGAILRGPAVFLDSGGPRPNVMIFFLSIKPSTKIFVNS